MRLYGNSICRAWPLIGPSIAAVKASPVRVYVIFFGKSCAGFSKTTSFMATFVDVKTASGWRDGFATYSSPFAPSRIRRNFTVNYKGKGTVDAGHKVIVWIFSDANLTSASRPLDTQFVAKNGDTVVFKNAPAEPVYVFAVSDEKGGYDGISGPPPHGLPASLVVPKAGLARCPE